MRSKEKKVISLHEQKPNETTDGHRLTQIIKYFNKDRQYGQDKRDKNDF